MVGVEFLRRQCENAVGGVLHASEVWSAWATSVVIALGIFFVYDIEYVTFMFVVMYLYLMLYAVKFNLAMYRERKEQR